MFILGDFNHCCLNKTLPGFDQYVKCNTRNERLLDKCYGNVKQAYTAKARPPLKDSDHIVIHLLPTYRSVFKSTKPEKHTIKLWTSEKSEELRGCFLSTDWDVFLNDADMDSATESITDYINFCIDAVIPSKTVRRYPNNKPYFNSDIKECIKRKNAAFKVGNKGAIRAAQKDLNFHLRTARRQHKDSAEQDLSECNARKLWDSIKQMTNMTVKRKPLSALNERARANDLNNFYMHFNVDNSEKCANVLENVVCDLNAHRIEIQLETVVKTFKCIYTKKATGPDGLSAFILKSFADELSPAWQKLFQLSVDSYSIPKLWKTSIILPIPKKASPQEDNDYRPVAITSNVFK